MAKVPRNSFETVRPSEADAKLARQSSQAMEKRRRSRSKRTGVQLRIVEDGNDSETVTVPASALRLLSRILAEMGQGHAVTLIPTHAELTTQQAADILNVSRPYVVKLLDSGKIPNRTVGKFRRIRLDDLLQFKRQDDDARDKILDQLTAEAQEMGLI